MRGGMRPLIEGVLVVVVLTIAAGAWLSGQVGAGVIWLAAAVVIIYCTLADASTH